jgi:succinylarginine dihydrolase
MDENQGDPCEGLGGRALEGDEPRECQFDSLVGLTHNYAGLAYGNVASQSHSAHPSNPRAAALQGLEKMKVVADWGIPQAVLPPLRRPKIEWLRDLGFEGSDDQVIRSAAREPVLLAAASSASSMWAANAATVSPAEDAADGRLHFTPANLASSLHRSLEAGSMTILLRRIFADAALFQVHDPLPSAVALTDEGAANHLRLAPHFGAAGIEVFVYGRHALDPTAPQPSRYPARQTLQASQAVARRHRLDPHRTFFVQQHPAAIDAGVFHNDVISVGHLNLLLTHSAAFVDQAVAVQQLQAGYRASFQQELLVAEIPETRLSLKEAVASYLFNSQLLSVENGQMLLVCPQECHDLPAARRTIEQLLAGEFTGGTQPIRDVRYLDLRQSMNNGGGPACLRLRVVMNGRQRQAVQGRIWLDDALYQDLQTWIQRHYPEQLRPADLGDPHLARLAQTAHRELEQIMELPLE